MDTVIVTEVEEEHTSVEEPLYSQVNKVRTKERQHSDTIDGGQGHKGDATDGSMTPEEEEVLQNLDDQIKMLEDRKSHLSSRAVIQINTGETAPLSTTDLSPQPPQLSVFTQQGSVDHHKMALLEEKARDILSDRDYTEVIRILEQYHQDKDLEPMVNTLVKILDQPDKMLLLRDVRGVLYPYHVGRYDNMMTYYEIEKYDDMSTKLHLPLRHSEKVAIKPKQNLMTTIMDENGHFHIRTINQHAKDVEIEKNVLQKLKSHSSQDSPHAPGPMRVPRQNSPWGTKALGGHTPELKQTPARSPTGPSSKAPQITLIETTQEPMVASKTLEPLQALITVAPPTEVQMTPSSTSEIQWVKLNHVEPQPQRSHSPRGSGWEGYAASPYR